ncbi:putative ribosomal RNA small subunit methyltransferase D [Candidatus Blochmanniella vafra str. BVAF]|uniref:Ribosomal RNA small subunit methyltransferase D n=1 Tax=Blochmanniella vafra (strain BVAF) TaxID=859654 RepID=E8Q7A4_BLOVB|nr:16S rRNA (guanine(966)-N(2))-methyltransferase RsmD [Candidatus Blochmannia vafer]ADV33999.1 putative ribosomal RNA small subunit methyltransferase D [Candidatus Blochmannia vafer str. BVAF]
MKIQANFSKSNNGKIRIIAGKWKGRSIPVISKIEVRPTLSRIRETLFNWLNPVIVNSICLDCFSGSGALGLESLSRGAKKVTFIDNSKACINFLKKTITSFQEDSSSITICTDCVSWLKQLSKNTVTGYNIVFIDPPFNNRFIIYDIVYLLEKNNYLQKKSWIYIETSKLFNKGLFNKNKFPNNWVLYRKIVTQTILCCIYFRSS